MAPHRPLVKKAVLASCYFLIMVGTIAYMMLINSRQRLNAVIRRRRALMFMRIKKMEKKKRKRKYWMKERSDAWWQNVVKPHFTDNDWMEYFRMTKATFQHIVRLTSPYMAPKAQSVREPLPADKKVAIALYQLANGCKYNVVENAFGVSTPTVHQCVYQFCRVMSGPMAEEFIQLPNDEEAAEISERIINRTNFPQTYGAIDRIHIPILPPKGENRYFINSEGWPSIILQAVVDDSHVFRDICCSSVGSVGDEDVLRNSSLWKKAESGDLPSASQKMSCQNIPPFLLGDSSYPSCEWIMQEYTGNLSDAEVNFNRCFSSARKVAEHAFKKLKCRWRVLIKRCDINCLFMPKVLATCCVLHNICELNDEVIPVNWMEESLLDKYPQPRHQPSDAPSNAEASLNRDVIRDFMENKRINLVEE